MKTHWCKGFEDIFTPNLPQEVTSFYIVLIDFGFKVTQCIIGLELALDSNVFVSFFGTELRKAVSVVYIDMFMLCCDDIKIIDMSNGVF